MTGPTGGGDSKTDSETFPVAEVLTLLWHTGNPKEASEERWAFAFSAKEDWKPKVRSDIAKIVQTGRGYSKAFFMSNQAIRDKVRADVEDELQKEHGIEVKIFDRTWILDQIYNSKLENLAIDELQISTSTRTEIKLGPLDVERKVELENLEKEIVTRVQSNHLTPQLADDCLRFAMLARGLERPRTELDGLFLRAEKVANQCGTPHQLLEVLYQKAWTTYWWHEDFAGLNEQYAAVEKLAKNSESVYELELLHNLWFLLYTTAGIGAMNRKVLQLDQRTVTLADSLQRLSCRADLPTSALHARAMLLLQHLGMTMPNPPVSVIAGLKEIIIESEAVVGFPLSSLSAIIIEMGQYVDGLAEYEDLSETVTAAIGKRAGDSAMADMLVERGLQRLNRESYYEGIDLLGRSLALLAKDEDRHDLIFALTACSYAYEQSALLWAARGTLLNAAALIMHEFNTHGTLYYLKGGAYKRFKWIELMLGRLPQVLLWHEVDFGLRRMLAPDGKIEPDESDVHFDAILGILFLGAKFDDLPQLTRIPDVLEDRGLFAARLALLYALGHVDNSDFELFNQGGKETVEEMMVLLRDQPAAREIPATPTLGSEDHIHLRSNLLGCDIRVAVENCAPCGEVAESFLAAIESLMATALKEGVVAKQSFIVMEVSQVDGAKEPFEFESTLLDGVLHYGVRCQKFAPYRMSRSSLMAIRERLFELAVDVLVRTYHLGEDHERKRDAQCLMISLAS